MLLKLTERYCVVYQTIKNGSKVSVSLQCVSGLPYGSLEDPTLPANFALRKI